MLRMVTCSFTWHQRWRTEEDMEIEEALFRKPDRHLYHSPGVTTMGVVGWFNQMSQFLRLTCERMAMEMYM